MAYDNDSELRIAITTDAELAALKQSKAELQGLLRTTEKNSEAAKGYTRILEDVDKALDSSNAKLIERAQYLQKLIELGEKTGADVSNETAELKQLGEQAKQSGISISDFSNASDVAGAVVRQSTGQVKAFGLGFRQLNRSMSAFTKYVPGLSLALRFVSGGALASMAAIMLLGTALDKLVQHFKKAKEEAEKFFEEMGKPALNAYKAAQEAADENAKSVRENAARIKELEDSYKTLSERMALYTEQAKLETQHRRTEQAAAHERELKDLEALHEAKLITEDEYYRRSQALAAKAEEDKRQAERDAEQQELEQKRAATQVLLAMNRELYTERGKIREPLEVERNWKRMHGGELGEMRKFTIEQRPVLAKLISEEAAALVAYEERKKSGLPTYFAREAVQKVSAKRYALEGELNKAEDAVSKGRVREGRLADLEAQDKKIQKRIDDTEDETKKLQREAAQLEALIQVRERYRQQSAQMSAQKQQEAAADRALAAEPGLLGGVREAYALGASGRATGSQRTALAALGISGPGTEAGYLATARRLALQRQAIIGRLAAGGLRIPEQRRLQKELDTLNAQLGSVTGGGEWERSQAPRYASGSAGAVATTGAAVLHAGEAVLNPGAVQALGANNIAALNAGAFEPIRPPVEIEDGAESYIGDPTVASVGGGAALLGGVGGFKLWKRRMDLTEASYKEARNLADTLGRNFTYSHKDWSRLPSWQRSKILDAFRRSTVRATGAAVSAASSAGATSTPRAVGAMGKAVTDRMLSSGGWSMLEPVSASVSATARGAGSNWRLAAMLAGSRFAAAAPRVAARIAAGELTHAGLNYLAGQVNTEAVTNQSGTSLADEGTGLGAVTGVGIDALAGYIEGGPAGAVYRAGIGMPGAPGFLLNAISGVNAAHGEWRSGVATRRAVDAAQGAHVPAMPRAAVPPPALPSLRIAIMNARGRATISAAEAALARANAAVAGSYSFGPAGANDRADQAARDREAQVRAAAIARSEDAARARAANDRRADELRLRDARAGNFTGLIGHQALAFHMEQASIVAQSVSTLQADIESRLKNARGAF